MKILKADNNKKVYNNKMRMTLQFSKVNITMKITKKLMKSRKMIILIHKINIFLEIMIIFYLKKIPIFK